MEVLNMCDEIGVLNRVCKPYPRSMKINVVGEGRLSTLKVVGFLAKLRLKLRQNIDLSDDPSIKELLSTLTTTKNIDTVIDPMMSGVWAGDIGKLSAKSTLAGILPELKDS
jgi:protoporphyrinogen oxidase